MIVDILLLLLLLLLWLWLWSLLISTYLFNKIKKRLRMGALGENYLSVYVTIYLHVIDFWGYIKQQQVGESFVCTYRMSRGVRKWPVMARLGSYMRVTRVVVR